MKALVWHGGAKMAIEEIPEPAVTNGRRVFRIEFAGICGSDLHGYVGNPGSRVPPLVLGHEAVGRVPGMQGAYVVFPLEVCGHCDACRRGRERLCQQRSLLGLDRQGVFAERVVVSADSLVAVPEGLAVHQAVLAEPLATAIAAFRISSEAAREVLIVGCGTIGLLAVYVSAASGAQIVVAEPLARRREHALALGAHTALAGASDIAPSSVDLVIDTAGVEGSWNAGIRALRSGGELVVIGLGHKGNDGRVLMGEVVRRGITVRGHYAYERADFEDALRMLLERPINLPWMNVMPLSKGPEAFRQLVNEPNSVTKILLAPDGTEAATLP